MSFRKYKNDPQSRSDALAEIGNAIDTASNVIKKLGFMYAYALAEKHPDGFADLATRIVAKCREAEHRVLNAQEHMLAVDRTTESGE